MKYGVVPIGQASNMTEQHEVISSTSRPESDTGLVGDDGQPIYAMSQWLVLKNSTWTPAQINEVEALGGQVLDGPAAFNTWKNENL